MAKKRKYTAEIVEKLLVQQGRCFYCGFPMPLATTNPALTITRDHFIPRAKGGKNKKNIVLCHQACNVGKADREPTKKEIMRFKEFRTRLCEHRKAVNDFHVSVKAEKE